MKPAEIIREGREHLAEFDRNGIAHGTMLHLRRALDALEEATKSLEIREALIRKLREPTEEHRRWVSLMDGTPDGTRPMNVYYTPRQEVIVCGDPSDEPDDADESRHNCDAMGCTSGSHVLWRGTLAAFWSMCEGHERAEAALAKAEAERDEQETRAQTAETHERELLALLEERTEERDEARRMYCSEVSSNERQLTRVGVVYSDGPRAPRRVCQQEWPAAADRLFPAGGGK